MRHYPAIAIILALQMLLGCQPTTSPTDEDGGRNADFLSFGYSSSDAWEEQRTLDACTIGGDGAVIALVEIVRDGVPVDKECSPDIKPAYIDFEAKSVTEIVGSLPSTFTLAGGLLDVDFGNPEVGDVYLFSMREYQGMFVPVHGVRVSLEPSQQLAVENTTTASVDLPHKRSALVSNIRDEQQMPSCSQAERSILFRLTNAEFEENLAPDRICEDSNAMPAGACDGDADCGEATVCVGGRCEPVCDPDVADAGCPVGP